MIDPPPTWTSVDRAAEPSSVGDPRGPVVPPPTAPSAGPDPIGSRARAFRQEQAGRRGRRRERIGELLVVAVIVLGIYTVVTARSYSGSSNYIPPNPGPTIVVHFGTPSASALTCGGGGTVYAERIPWTNSTQPIITGDVNVRVYEIADGDYIGDPGAVANVTPSNPCAGTPPTAETVWYVVLVAPNGTNLLTYTVDDGWASVAQRAVNVGVENGSALILVTHVSLVGTGRGLAVYGVDNESPISGSIPL